MLNGSDLNSAAVNSESVEYNDLFISAPILRPAVSLFHDWTNALASNQPEQYVCDLIGSATYRLPISSWQATVQSGRASYLSIVVPAVGNYLENINAESDGTIRVSRVSRTIRGETVEKEMASAPISDIRTDRGPLRYSCSISGYGDPVESGAGESRTLEGVRSISSQINTHRARAGIDWLLRPGHTVIAGDVSFTVAYINYYVNLTDAYMDVGSRSE